VTETPVMEIAAAAILGIIQGLTEFLPISSSAHLILVPWLLGWDPEGLTFDVALHVGTALAILIYFRTEWIRLGREALRGLVDGRPLGSPQRRLAWYLVLGTVPAAIAGLTLEEVVENQLRSPLVTVVTLAVFGVLLYVADVRGRHSRDLESLGWADALWIGICQAVALVPGVSRSGITITMAMLRGLDRSSSTRFSFLLATPIVVGAGILACYRLLASASGPEAVAIRWDVLAAGSIAATIVGMLCIKYFLRYLRTRTFTPFVIYRMVLAFIVLMYYMN